MLNVFVLIAKFSHEKQLLYHVMMRNPANPAGTDHDQRGERPAEHRVRLRWSGGVVELIFKMSSLWDTICV